MDKGLAISLRGPQATAALESFKKQLDAWGLALPPVEPLVLDFGLGEFYSTGMIEYWICNEMEAGYCCKYLFVFGGQSCPLHQHREKHETFFVLKGEAQMNCGECSETMVPASTLRVTPGTVHGFTGRGPVLLLEVSKPCFIADNYFENTRIPIGGNYRGSVNT